MGDCPSTRNCRAYWGPNNEGPYNDWAGVEDFEAGKRTHSLEDVDAEFGIDLDELRKEEGGQ